MSSLLLLLLLLLRKTYTGCFAAFRPLRPPRPLPAPNVWPLPRPLRLEDTAARPHGKVSWYADRQQWYDDNTENTAMFIDTSVINLLLPFLLLCL